MIEISGNFNMLEYLKSIKELWEAKSVYEQTVASLTNQYNKLGRQKTYNNIQNKNDFIFSILLYLLFTLLMTITFAIPSFIIYYIYNFIKDNDLNIKITIIIIICNILFGLIIAFPETIMDYIKKRKEQKRINELRQKAYEQAKYEKEVLQPPILEKINHYKMKIKEVENAINELYDFGIIHKDYQHYNAAVLFYNYMESGRCEDIRECMLKFDNDSEIMHMHEKIDLMNAKFEQLQKTTLHQLHSLRSSVESNISRTRNLIEQSQKQTQSQLDSLEYNVHINTLMTREYIDELRNSN